MTKLRFDGKVAIVTGAGRGLGRDYALMLASRGARVVVNDFACQPDGSASDETPAEAVVREIRDAGGDAIADRHSVTDDASAIVAAAVEKYGRLDILINNAGISGGGWFAEIPPASWDLMVDTHLGALSSASLASKLKKLAPQ